MDISLKVLNRYIKVDDQDPKELADKITSIGLEAVSYTHLDVYKRQEERGFRKRWKKILTKVKKECKIRKSAKERPIREIIEN